MKSTHRMAGAIAGSALMVAGAGLGALTALAQNDQAFTPVPQGQHARADADLVAVPNPQGSFSFTQDKLSSDADIKAAFKGASQAICGSIRVAGQEIAARSVRVSSPERSFDATVQEMAESGEAQHFVMACVCMGNPAGGRDVVNADVDGVSVASIAKLAGVAASK